MKILAIDDNRDNLTTLQAIMQDSLPGGTLLTATNGIHGLELARAEDPDVILLDIVMPEIDGFEVCRRLKADPALSSIPVIFLTALRTDRESRIQALAVGAEMFLSKPIDEMELVAQILAMAKIKASNRFKKLEKDELAALVAQRTLELEEELARRKVTEAAQSFLAKTTSSSTGEHFFNLLAGFLAENLRMDFVCIDLLEGDGLNARTLAVWHNGKFEDNVTYALKDTPCGSVVGHEVCCFTAGVTGLFPNDPVLQDLRAESYAGVTLWSHDGKPIGLIAVISRNPLANRLQVEATLKMVAVRAAGELERLQAEAELRASNTFNDSLLRTIPFGLEIVDQAGHILFQNSRMAQVVDRPVLGATCWQVYRDDKQQCVDCPLKSPIVPGETKTMETDGVLGGRFFEITHTGMLYHGQPALLEVFRDITERKLAEAKLHEAQTLLQAAMDHSPAGIAIADAPDGKLRYVNNAALLMRGGDRESIVNGVGIAQYVASWKLFDLDGVRPLQAEEVPLTRAVMSGEASRRKFIIRRSPGDDRIVSASAAPIQDDQGRVVAGIVIFEDITEYKIIEEQLRHAQKMESIGQLAGGVAHDFNNILNGMFLQLDLLKLEGPLTAGVREGLDQLGKDSRRAAALVRQLLLYSRRQMMQRRDLDLNEVVTHFSQMLQRVIREDIRLEFQLNPGALPLHADPGMIEQVLMNLAVNARDAMPKGGLLMIATSKITLDAIAAPRLNAEAGPGDYVCLSVSDTGTGIPPAVLPKIFEPFFTTKDVGKGTGLGLASVFGIVKQHQGGIEVDNRPGQGVTFRIYLPALSAPGTPAQAGLVADQPAVRRGTETILLVEDEESLRKLTRMILERQGYQVLPAANGVAALELWKLNRSSVNLLLTDMVMPEGVSGLELARRMQTEKPELKVIYISGYSQDAIKEGSHLRVGKNFLQKPIAADSLLRLIRQILDP